MRNATKHARRCIHRSKEILITRFNALGKMKFFCKKKNTEKCKTFKLKFVSLQTYFDFPLFGGFIFQHKFNKLYQKEQNQ